MEELLAITDGIQNFTPSHHVALLHNNLGQKTDDVYLGNIILALQSFGHTISIFAAGYEEENVVDLLQLDKEKLNLIRCLSWFPNSICGCLQPTMAKFKTALMAFRLVLMPPKPRPKVVVLDTDSIAIMILSKFGFYKTIFIPKFPQLEQIETYHSSMRVTSDLLTMKCIKYADEIILQTKCLEEVFRRSYPKVHCPITILPTCCDTGIWNSDTIDIRRIIPDLPEEFILFVAFGHYRKRSNFKLLLNTLEHVFTSADKDIKKKLHFAIAGHCNKKSVEENLYYYDLVNKTKGKSYGSSVTFLKQLPTVHKKTLLESCTAVIHTAKHDLYEGCILAAMYMGRPIIATNAGFPNEVLTNRLTGILLEPDPVQFARVINKISNSPTLEVFIGKMAKNSFDGHYSFDRFAEKMNNVITNAHTRKTRRT